MDLFHIIMSVIIILLAGYLLSSNRETGEHYMIKRDVTSQLMKRLELEKDIVSQLAMRSEVETKISSQLERRLEMEKDVTALIENRLEIEHSISGKVRTLLSKVEDHMSDLEKIFSSIDGRFIDMEKCMAAAQSLEVLEKLLDKESDIVDKIHHTTSGLYAASSTVCFSSSCTLSESESSTSNNIEVAKLSDPSSILSSVTISSSPVLSLPVSSSSAAGLKDKAIDTEAVRRLIHQITQVLIQFPRLRSQK
jgi:isoleucyl-tRNA synthetase